MDNVSIVGIDISKRSFQLHGATASGAPVMRKKLSRGKVLEFLGSQPPCLVVMEACGGAHYWGREIQQLGHEVRLIAPVYVKPFVKRRQKNDANDAAAIIEAAQRPTMRFVAVKTEQAQASSMLFRTRGLLVQQRTQTVNALRGHLAEFGLVAARGVANVKQLWQTFAQCADTLPELVVRNAGLLFDRVAELTAQIDALDKQVRSIVRGDDEMRRLMTIPGVGEVSAMAVRAFAPAMESFGRGRDFAAWIGLTPREASTAGRQRLGRITRMGQRDLRQLLVLGATAVVRHARRRKEIEDPWLRRMLAEKPPKLVAVALANKMARIIWALLVKEESYRAPTMVGAVAG